MSGLGDPPRDPDLGQGEMDEWTLTQPRSTVIDGLVATGMARVIAEMWCDLWVLQGRGEPVPRPAGFWQAGKEWIDAQRAGGQQSDP